MKLRDVILLAVKTNPMSYIHEMPRQGITPALLKKNEQAILLMEKALNELKSSVTGNPALAGESLPPLTWTASKTALIELIYAFQSYGVFNNGNAELRQVATFFEKIFGLELGNYYRTFLDIRIRKCSRTVFLDELKERLVRRMDETDENPKIMYSV